MHITLNLKSVEHQSELTIVTAEDKESQLVKALLAGKRSAQEAFYKSYFPQMFPTAMRYASNKEDAYEIINTAFLKVINSMKVYKHQGNFGGWIKTIVKRTSIDYCRKFKYNKPTTFELIDVDKHVYNNALSSLELEDAVELLQKLPPASRTVFNLFVFEELSHEEISEKLGISKGTSKWHVSNARKSLLQLSISNK